MWSLIIVLAGLIVLVVVAVVYSQVRRRRNVKEQVKQMRQQRDTVVKRNINQLELSIEMKPLDQLHTSSQQPTLQHSTMTSSWQVSSQQFRNSHPQNAYIIEELPEPID